MGIRIDDNTSPTYPQDYPVGRVSDPPPNRWQNGAAAPLPPHLAGRGFDPNTADFSLFDSLNAGPSSLNAGPTGPTGPVPSTPVKGNPFFNFLSSLFGQSGGSAPQGMTGLLGQGGQRRPGVDMLGNPVNRF